jgi:hypothetical protein
MNLVQILEKHNLKPYSLFLLAEYNNKEGLLFFDLVFTRVKDPEEIKYEFEDKEEEISYEKFVELQSNEETADKVRFYIEPKLFIVDGADFIFDETMEDNTYVLVENPDSKQIIFYFLDGDEFNLNLNEMENFPFKLKKIEKTKKNNLINKNFVKIEE